MGAVAFENLNIGKMYGMTQAQRKSHEAYPTYALHRSTRPKFSPVSLYDQGFQDFAHFMIFPLTPMLKFPSSIKCLIFRRMPNQNNFIYLSHNFLLRSDENCRNSVLTFSAPYGPVLTKFQSVIIFLNLSRLPKK